MKTRIILLFTSISLLAWSAATEAEMSGHADSRQKPSVEVNLGALEQLKHMSTPAEPQAVPTPQAQIPVSVPPAPPVQPRIGQPQIAIPAESTPQRKFQPHQYQAPLPPSAFSNEPRKSLSHITTLPPLIPPYPSGHTKPQRRAELTQHASDKGWLEDSWVEDTGDFFTSFFDSDSKAPAAAPTSRVAKIEPITSPPIAASNVADPVAAPAPNAARYDGYELAQSLVDKPNQAPDLNVTLPQENAPLPKPISPEQEVLLAEITQVPSPTATAPKLMKRLEPREVDLSRPTPVVQAAPKTVPAKQVKEEDTSWFGELRNELDDYFSSEEQTQEEMKERFVAPTLQADDGEIKTVTAPKLIHKPLPTTPPQPQARQMAREAPAAAASEPDVAKLADKVSESLAPKHPNMMISMEPEATAPNVKVRRALATELAKDPSVSIKPTQQAKSSTLVPAPKAKPAPVVKPEVKKVVKTTPPPPIKEKSKAPIAPEASTIAEKSITTPASDVASTARKIVMEAEDAVAAPTPKPITKPIEAVTTASTTTAEAIKTVTLNVPDAPETLTVASLPKQASTPTTTSTQANANAATLSFTGANTELSGSAKKHLDKLATQLKSNDSGRLTIRAYASSEKEQKVNARRIALARGLAVRSYLIDQGVSALRINVQSLGNTKGVDTPDEVIVEFKDTNGS